MTPEETEKDKSRWFTAWQIVNKLQNRYQRLERLRQIEAEQGGDEREIIEDRVIEMWKQRKAE